MMLKLTTSHFSDIPEWYATDLGTEYEPYIKCGGTYIAEVCLMEDREETEANARVLGAAADMYFLLCDIAEGWDREAEVKKLLRQIEGEDE